MVSLKTRNFLNRDPLLTGAGGYLTAVQLTTQSIRIASLILFLQNSTIELSPEFSSAELSSAEPEHLLKRPQKKIRTY